MRGSGARGVSLMNVRPGVGKTGLTRRPQSRRVRVARPLASPDLYSIFAIKVWIRTVRYSQRLLVTSPSH